MMISGKGFYIWKVRYTEGGNIFAIVEKAVQAGLSHVLIKAADGGYLYNVFEGKDLLPELVDALKAAHIQVWLWQYIFGNPAAEAMAAIHRCQQLQPDGWVVDAEVEMKGKPAAAESYMKMLRTGIGNDLLVALSTYRWPTVHPEFPFDSFMPYIDFNMPQMYWMQAHDPRAQLVRTLSEYKQFNKPIFPTGACFREAGWQPTAAEISEFMQACKDLSLQGCNFWEWGNARLYVNDGWEVIRSTGWVTPPAAKPLPVSLPISEGLRLRALIEGQKIRTGPGISYPEIDQLHAGDLVNAIGLAGSDTWVQIGPNQWAAFRYAGKQYMELV